MAVHPIEPIIARSASKRTPSVRPAPKPAPRPQARGGVAYELVDIEGELFEASAELVYQRDDLAEAASDENNRALVRAIRAIDDGDYVLARDLIRVALMVEETEDAAVERARRRRETIHGRTRNATARVDGLLTGKEYALPWPLDGVMASGICGAERAPMGAITFDRCSQDAGHEEDGRVHVFLSVAPEGTEQP